jgi:hypothetical protein
MLELLINITKLLQGYSLVKTHLLRIQGKTRIEQLKFDAAKFKSVLGRTFPAP